MSKKIRKSVYQITRKNVIFEVKYKSHSWIITLIDGDRRLELAEQYAKKKLALEAIKPCNIP